MRKEVLVYNKSAGKLVYSFPDGFRREFAAGEKAMIPVAELEKLSQQPYGKTMIAQFLQVYDPVVVRYLLNGGVGPEYWITEEQLPNWMNTCSLAAFQDALDFAPLGTKELIKRYAVSMPLNDYAKCRAIKEQLGYDVEAMIKMREEEEAEKPAAAVPSARRAEVKTATQALAAEPRQRRVQ